MIDLETLKDELNPEQYQAEEQRKRSDENACNKLRHIITPFRYLRRIFEAFLRDALQLSQDTNRSDRSRCNRCSLFRHCTDKFHLSLLR